ncbi:MAG: MFS transporter [Gemmatimonadetes bacterium]|nr:MFS transporter [Gemmatimonadota bacterium]
MSEPTGEENPAPNHAAARARARARVLSSFPALRHRDFRLLWIGQLLSMSGSQMQSAAILWHVSLLVDPRHKGLALGAVGLVKVVPIVAFSLISGVVADAVDRRKVMIVTQTLMAVMAGVLALLTFRGLSVAWPVYLLAGLSSAAAAFDGPSRQSLIPNLVPREHPGNAISLNTIMFQASAIAGPSLAGITIATVGVASVYLLNALSFLFVIGALLVMHSGGRAQGVAAGRISMESAWEGLRFVFRAPIIRSTMLVDFFATFFASANALLPIFAQDILHVGPRGYGWLYAAPSIGAVLASLLMVSLVDRIERRGAVLLWSVTGFGLATVVFGLSRSYWLTLACLGLIGAADTVSMVIRNVVRQMETPDELRGRMTGVNMIFFMGGPQLGEAEAGLVAQWLGATVSVVTGGIGCLIATSAVAAAEPVLRKYRRG